MTGKRRVTPSLGHGERTVGISRYLGKSDPCRKSDQPAASPADSTPGEDGASDTGCAGISPC